MRQQHIVLSQRRWVSVTPPPPPPLYLQLNSIIFIFHSRPHSTTNTNNEEDDDNSSYTLTFTIEFDYDDDTVYFAHSYPYTYSDLQVSCKPSNLWLLWLVNLPLRLLQDYLMEIQRHPVKSKFCKLRLLCRTLAGNNVYYLTVTAPSGNEDHMRVGCHPCHCSFTKLTHSLRYWCAAQEIHCGISTCASQWDASVVDDEGSDGLHNRRLDGGQALATQIHIQACANAESRWRHCG